MPGRPHRRDRHRFLIHDRDAIYAPSVDGAVAAMGRRVVKTPVRTPQANAFCERVIGTMRRECLDWLIPLNERHLRWILRAWVTHYNRGRPHASLGPGIPDSVTGADSAGTRAAITSPLDLTWSRRRSSTDCTTNIAWSARPHDAESSTRIVFAEHRGRRLRAGSDGGGIIGEAQDLTRKRSSS